MMFRLQNHTQRSYLVTSRHVKEAETNRKILESVNSLMLEDKAKTQKAFDKVAPLVNEVFGALANYDIRFEFSELSLDSCNVERIMENEYTILCPLKELPEEHLRLEGKDSTGALAVRLSRAYEDSIDKVSWEDISLPPDDKGCRYFSTTRLLQVLTARLKHAIDDVNRTDGENNDKEKSLSCKQKNDMVYLEVKVSDCYQRLNLLPCIPLTQEIMKSLSMDGRITRITKHMRVETTETAYLVAKPLLKHPEKLWRITVNNIEESILRQIFDSTECGNHCLFALTVMNEQLFSEKKNKGLVPQYLTRMALLEEFLKYPNLNHWRSKYFTVRVDSTLRSLEEHVYKKDLKNVLTGVNIVAHRAKDNLVELLNDVGRVRVEFRRYFS